MARSLIGIVLELATLSLVDPERVEELLASVLGLLVVAASWSADSLAVASARLLFVFMGLNMEDVSRGNAQWPRDAYLLLLLAAVRRARYSSSVSSGMFRRVSRSDQNRSLVVAAIARAPTML